jgi:hypothetical protein
MSSDDSLSQGSHGFRVAGTGLAMTRHCLVGDNNVSQTAGGRYVRFRGVKAYACNTCAERLDAKRLTNTAA